MTGEHHALAYEPFQPIRYISVDRDGRATTRARIDLPHIPLIHDMAFTQSFIVVPDFPVTLIRTARTKARPSWSGGRSIARPGD